MPRQRREKGKVIGNDAARAAAKTRTKSINKAEGYVKRDEAYRRLSAQDTGYTCFYEVSKEKGSRMVKDSYSAGYLTDLEEKIAESEIPKQDLCVLLLNASVPRKAKFPLRHAILTWQDLNSLSSSGTAHPKEPLSKWLSELESKKFQQPLHEGTKDWERERRKALKDDPTLTGEDRKKKLANLSSMSSRRREWEQRQDRTGAGSATMQARQGGMSGVEGETGDGEGAYVLSDTGSEISWAYKTHRPNSEDWRDAESTGDQGQGANDLGLFTGSGTDQTTTGVEDNQIVNGDAYDYGDGSIDYENDDERPYAFEIGDETN